MLGAGVWVDVTLAVGEATAVAFGAVVADAVTDGELVDGTLVEGELVGSTTLAVAFGVVVDVAVAASPLMTGGRVVVLAPWSTCAAQAASGTMSKATSTGRRRTSRLM